ncbi:hypothetical protein K9B46_24460, partial [Klebsiella aerogenes]|uniref:hypothetical protein n=1 Tax=Klebsiella aerogenes TaxID=548 RepID=UPI001CBE7CF7
IEGMVVRSTQREQWSLAVPVFLPPREHLANPLNEEWGMKQIVRGTPPPGVLESKVPAEATMS